MRIRVSPRAVFAALTGLLLVGVTGSVAVADSRSDPPADWLPGVADSSKLSTPVIASGKVRGPGETTTAGALVELRAWPSVDRLDAMGEGDQFALEPVAKAVADSDGRYELRVDPAKSLDSFAAENGIIDLEVVVSSDEWFGVSTFSAVAADSEAAGDSTVATRSASGEVTSAARADVSLRGEFADAQTSDVDTLGCDVVEGLGKRWTLLGTSHSRSTGAKITFTHKESSSSSLGVGVSTGTWHQDGEVSRESTVTTTYPPALGMSGGKGYYTKFRYAKYACVAGWPEPYTWDEARPTTHYGGAKKEDLGVINAFECVRHLAGTSLEVDEATAHEYGGGVKIESRIGIDLSARTGYSSSAKFRYEATKDRYFCGDTDGPANAERVVNKRRVNGLD